MYFGLSTFAGSGFIPSELSIIPQYFISLLPNFHLLRFKVRSAELIASITSDRVNML